MGTIKVDGLGKVYKIYAHRWQRFGEWLAPWAGARHDEHWVLRGIDFTIKAGEAVGIVGRNGAGKSTLLKLLAGTTKATEGTVQIDGRIAALLELGMGFHPEFTGRQNLYMAGLLLGMARDELDVLTPEILDFAEIGDAIDQPLRTYSSGMHLRLAFSLATAAEPDILIVDEALAVGDAAFQHKCFRRIRDFRDNGVTLLFVSHDPLAVKSICDRAILLEGGSIALDGTPDLVLDYYNALIATGARSEEKPLIVQSQSQTRSGSQQARILRVSMSHRGVDAQSVVVGEPVSILVDYEVAHALGGLTVGILIRDRLGNDVYGTNTNFLGFPLPADAMGQVCVEFIIPSLRLGVGTYSITVALHADASHLDANYDWWDQALTFQVTAAESNRFVGVVKLDAAARLVSPVPSSPCRDASQAP